MSLSLGTTGRLRSVVAAAAEKMARREEGAQGSKNGSESSGEAAAAGGGGEEYDDDNDDDDDHDSDKELIAWLRGRHDLPPPLLSHAMATARELAGEARAVATREVQLTRKLDPPPPEALVSDAAMRGFFSTMGFIPRPVQRGGKGSRKRKRRRRRRRRRGERGSAKRSKEGEEEGEEEEEEPEGVRAAEKEASGRGETFLNALLSQTAAAMVAELGSSGSPRVVRRALLEIAEKRGRSVRVMR